MKSSAPVDLDTRLDQEAVSRALSDPERLAQVRKVNLADMRERRLDWICAEASELLQTPVVHMTILEEDQASFVAAKGLPEDVDDLRATGLEYSICKYVVALDEQLLIRDALVERFLIGNLAVVEWGVRSYLGEPVRAPSGEVLGSFCALSYEPRDWSYEDQMILLRMTQMATAALLAK